MTESNPQHRFVARLALFVLGVTASVSALVWMNRAGSADPRPLDQIIPPLSTVLNSIAWIAVWLRPRKARLMMFVSALFFIVMMTLSSGWFIYLALQPGARPLLEVLQPHAAILMATMLIALLFFRPDTSLRLSLAAWVLVALPVLVYLAAHPEERQSARGLELMLILGPVALVLAVMIPLQRRRERRMIDLRHAERRARSRAIRDPLTNLFNRRAFEARLARTIAQGGRTQQLILLDIDHFKSINDTHGHPTGDAVLREIASRCDATLGRSALFARWGGEEFAAICQLDEGDPRNVAERLRAAISAQPIDPVGAVTASFGVTRIRTDDGLESAVKRADEALYVAKQAGRNRVEMG